jgi:hypothetical protein
MNAPLSLLEIKIVGEKKEMCVETRTMVLGLIFFADCRLCSRDKKLFNAIFLYANLAQLAEHFIRNERVVGSNPIVGSVI